MQEPYFVIEALAEHNPHRIRRKMSDLVALEKDLEEIEARAASRQPSNAKEQNDVVALAFAAQAGDAEARQKLRRQAGRG
ncbi:MAG: hypothetical protein ACO1OG_08535 [Devosia sp.]